MHCVISYKRVKLRRGKKGGDVLKPKCVTAASGAKPCNLLEIMFTPCLDNDKGAFKLLERLIYGVLLFPSITAGQKSCFGFY